MDVKTFRQHVSDLGISLTETQLKQFDTYYRLLIQWNQKMNLTAITDQNEVYEKHFFDSLTPAQFVDFQQIETVIDVGSGAGFPGIPLKICFPHLHISFLDSLKKRLQFLETVTDQLGLEDVHFIHGRAEDMGQNPRHREQYDVSVARAVAKLSVLSEYCLPFVKVGGSFLAMKGAQVTVELSEAKNAIQLLGGKTKQVHSFNLPIEKSERHVIVVEKRERTPSKYPRKAGVPSKRPIV
ncbi:MAG: 16S rRNA (guanine(527)-N(7))-methyltransferase RsmG [Bacillaceae bacterium]|nr:16S rRNA (guanine(527)-N(7))-methyltransferase RsmG [Bacillaceae bacterium]